MNRTLLSLIGSIIIWSLLPGVSTAQETEKFSLFKSIFTGATLGAGQVRPLGDFMNYIKEEFKDWREHGLKLTDDHIRAAIEGTLCKTNDESDFVLKDKDDNDILPNILSCNDIAEAIREFIFREQQMLEFGTELTILTTGSEAAIADEPHRPVNMSVVAVTLRRIWSGSGTSTIPWNTENDDLLKELEEALKAEKDLVRTVYKYHHGYFRSKREDDPRLTDIGNDVGEKLKKIADKLSITGDEKMVGDFITPAIKVPNVALWATKNDIGIHFIYPIHFSYPIIERASADYPSLVVDGNNLSYPFSYKGTNAASNTLSPICSKTIGRLGYLCHSNKSTTRLCKDPKDPTKISLIECSKPEDKTGKDHPLGPELCKGMNQFFTDAGIPFEDPAHPGTINPNLTKADRAKMCTPERMILYADDIASHACYISFCVAQSMSGHTLIPNRNPVVGNEMTSPFLACLRPDPELGHYSEIPSASLYPIPPYIGPELIADFERKYCLAEGSGPRAVLGLCTFHDDAIARKPMATSLEQGTKILGETYQGAFSQQDVLDLAMVFGLRASLQQTVEVHRKVFGALAGVVDQISSLVMSLKKAPLPLSACPWTGPPPEKDPTK